MAYDSEPYNSAFRYQVWNIMASGRGDDNVSDDESTKKASSPSFDPYNDGSYGMKPTFDAMLKDIEKSLPSLDDDDSDFEVIDLSVGIKIFQLYSNSKYATLLLLG